MFSFKKKVTSLNSEEYEKLSIRLTDAEKELEKILSRFLSLRGLIHRKYTGDVVGAETEKNKNIDGLDGLRNHGIAI